MAVIDHIRLLHLIAACSFSFVTGLRAADPQPLPQVIQCHAACDADTVTVLFNKSVQLDGSYALDGNGIVWSKHYGMSMAEVVLETSSLSPGRTYELTVTGVHDLEAPANLVIPQPTLWSVACVGACGPLSLRSVADGSFIVEWNAPAAALETSTDLLAWTNLANATSPLFVSPVASASRFFRLRCSSGSGPEPGIVGQPGSAAANAGATVRFSVAATGAALSFQWLFNGTNLAGATNSILRLMSVGSAQVGVYELRATNAFGAVTSAPAYLVVNNNTDGLPFNTTRAQPPAAVLLLSSQNSFGLPFNTTTADPAVRMLLINAQGSPDFPLNITVATPPVATLIGTNQTGAPFGNTP